MPSHQKKSTKKFEKKHLKPTLERRKEFAKVKQRHQLKEKKKARRARDNAAVDTEREAKAEKRKDAEAIAAEKFKNMTVDEFFAGGFNIENDQPKEKASKSVTGKRKREIEEEEEDEGFEEQPLQSESGEEEVEEGEKGHKDDLEALAKKDPEFYKFLQENDAELLDFDDDALAGLELSEDEESPQQKRKGKKSKEDEADNAVTLGMVEKWEQSLVNQRSLKALREVILAFRAAVRSNDEDGKEYKYSVSSAEVYHQLLMVALRQIPDVVRHHIRIKELASGKIRVPTDSKKYKNLTPVLNSHAVSITYLLETLSDESTLKLTLTCIEPLLPYLLSARKALKNLIKTIIGVWSDASSSETIKVAAFLLIRKLAIIGDSAIRETLLKSTYQDLIKGCRNTTAHTLAGINLMKNTAVDLWGADLDLSYTTGFTYLRQLAIHLRKTLTHPTKDSYKAIYNWQYVHSLDFWSRVFSTHCSPTTNPLLKKPTDSPLHPLIYPLVQVTLGALRLIPTPTYFPLRFHLTRSLLRISWATNTYIPLAASLLEVLQSPEDSAKPSTLKPLDFATSLRAPKQYSKTRVYQDGIMEQVSDLLAEFFGIWAKSVAFPELIIPPTVLLKRWMKEVLHPNRSQQERGGKGKKGPKKASPKLTASISLLLQKLNLNAEFIVRHRRKIEFAPKDREQLDSFLKDVPWEDTPMGAFVTGTRQQREEKDKLLEQSRREEEERRKKDRHEEMDVGVGHEDVFEDIEDEEEEEEADSEGGRGAARNGREKKVNRPANGRSHKGGMQMNEDTDASEDEEDLPDAEEGFIDDEAMEDDEVESDDEDDIESN